MQWKRFSNPTSRRWLLNAFSLNMVPAETTLIVRPLTVAQARTLAETAQSAVGHADTAAVFSSMLGMEVQSARATVALAPGDEAIVGQYKGPRLPEGATQLPAGATSHDRVAARDRAVTDGRSGRQRLSVARVMGWSPRGDQGILACA